jgi:hypothetical protein
MSAISGGPLGATRGRFWSLSSGDDDDSDDSYESGDGQDSDDGPGVGSDAGNVQVSPVAISLKAISVYYKTPDEEPCSLPSSTASALLRRELKKLRQREAAIQLIPGTPESPGSSFSPFQKFTAIGRKVRIQSLVLSPSTFLLDSFDAFEWVLVQRRIRLNRGRQRRGVWPPARSGRSACQRTFSPDQISKCSPMGQLGSADTCDNENCVHIGRMGHHTTQIHGITVRIPQFTRGLR